jgi:ABC-type transport system substrate-binding protein
MLARVGLVTVLVALVLAACATPTPAVVVQTQIVQETVEVPVEVVETVEVEVPVDVIVTATSVPLGDFTLRAAHYGKWETFNPLTIYGGNMVDTAQRVFSALVAQDVNGKVFGDLAESWDVSSDGTTYTFALRPNVTWHDGDAFSAEDVVFTFEMAANPETGSVYSSQLEQPRPGDADQHLHAAEPSVGGHGPGRLPGQHLCAGGAGWHGPV